MKALRACCSDLLKMFESTLEKDMELMPVGLSFECSESLSGVPPPSARLFEPQQCERIQGIQGIIFFNYFTFGNSV